ncbi:hypothetical protein [Cellulomonas fengjieae]|uniref:hypothetical protein n=1 Tax=Cellulomonas fengjieae TaxID=2819978 RepID=UPI001AAE3B85|nr:hypothetical protein [Cellulomonas fengjieae]MBO3100842.1 hypothetical protein [Cellulomonas fengjieae]
MGTAGISRARWVRYGAVVAFGIGFGYVEAAVVHYLRLVLGPQLDYDAPVRRVYLDLGVIRFVDPVQPMLVDPDLARAETVREAATILMLAAVAVLAGRGFWHGVAAFFIAFTVWDLTYYLFLRVLTGWPTSLADTDVFFLIPVTWLGPVATPVVASAVVLAVSSWWYLRPVQWAHPTS